ncbi:hypothetical protein [Streptomyces beihaiensis]|uniref:Chitosanase n=1 Tax=Streptomyces beihaiensis TaxID=2984495 RepID=A0ABT3U3C3_9ACTN|nr:hypothetical protein [Streptomyces beihaiensis]MCX3063540.1 chitosanase [Streptomyces beihaiensis]
MPWVSSPESSSLGWKAQVRGDAVVMHGDGDGPTRFGSIRRRAPRHSLDPPLNRKVCGDSHHIG